MDSTRENPLVAQFQAKDSAFDQRHREDEDSSDAMTAPHNLAINTTTPSRPRLGLANVGRSNEASVYRVGDFESFEGFSRDFRGGDGDVSSGVSGNGAGTEPTSHNVDPSKQNPLQNPLQTPPQPSQAFFQSLTSPMRSPGFAGQIHELSPYQYNIPHHIQDVTNLPSPAAVSMRDDTLHYAKPRSHKKMGPSVTERIVSEYDSSRILQPAPSFKSGARIVSTPLATYTEAEPEEINRDHTPNRTEQGRYYKAYDRTTSALITWKSIEEIGRGSYSVVSLAEPVESPIGVPVGFVAAVKVSRPSETEDSLRSRVERGLIREFELLQEIRHPCIVELLGSRVESEEVIMVMTYYPGGNLFSFASEYRPLITSEHVKAIFSNVVSAVNYLHENSIVHRDIKLENILLRIEPRKLAAMGAQELERTKQLVVLTDFGLSKKIDPKNPLMRTRCGSEYYVSPELLMGLPYDGRQNDVWALGVLLYALVEGRSPFDPLPVNPNSRVSQSSRRAVPKLAHRIALIAWDWFYFADDKLSQMHASEAHEWQCARDIVTSCLCRREKRNTIRDIYENPWFTKYRC